MSFRRVLVANRGEIACRVFRTLRTLGIEGAAIYSEADVDAPHVRAADHARCVGPAAARESYLDVEKVLEAAREMQCDAVHPGYGFLSENAAFAEACAAAGLTFLGPPPEAIRVMGDKAEARALATKVGVSPVPGYEGDDDPAALEAAAGEIGYPLLVKAAAGGGGKGMRRVERAEDLGDALAAARREAEGAFGDGTLLLERMVTMARHVEVQILADTHGNVAPLLERECSLQRRHQKVIEECPSPAVDPALRKRLGEAACTLARAVDYVGAGTVEFLLEEDGRFWFLEMNTRLQVEHGVTELVTDLDLVDWQLKVAAGERLPERLMNLEPRGWAMEARLYAEDPQAGFLPQAGHLEVLGLPEGPGIRVDSGVVAGQEISAHYDPMILKMMAWGEDREAARQRLLAALEGTRVIGPPTNLAYLADLLRWPAFQDGATFTHSLETDRPGLDDAPPPPEAAAWLALAALELRQGRSATRTEGAAADTDRWSPFEELGRLRFVPSPEEAS